YFDAFIDGGVEVAHDQRAEGYADAVDVHARDVEAACVVGGAVGLGGIDVDASGHLQHRVDVDQAEVGDGFGIEHGERLRRVVDAQVETGGATAVAVGAHRLDQYLFNGAARSGIG